MNRSLNVSAHEHHSHTAKDGIISASHTGKVTKNCCKPKGIVEKFCSISDFVQYIVQKPFDFLNYDNRDELPNEEQ